MNNTFHSLNGAPALLALAVMPHLLASALAAATITVKNTKDAGTGSLRQAIQNASPGDTINFSVAGTITLTSGELLVVKDLTIAGPGASSLAISGHTNSRVFEIGSNVRVSITGLTIRDGHAPDGATAGASGAHGGGIYNAGNLTLGACAVSSNSAGNGFSYVPRPGVYGSAGGPGGLGGGIYNGGTLALASCTISGNAGGVGGRGGNNLGGAAPVGGVGGLGGGIYNAGISTLTNCTLDSNTGGVGGVGGVRGSIATVSHGAPGGTGGAGGGAFNAGALSLIACTLSGNAAGAGGTGGNGHYGGQGGVGGGGGAICNAASAPAVTLRNSLAALNQAGTGGAGAPGAGVPGTEGTAGTGPDLCGAFTSQAHNLAGQADGSTGLTNGVNSDLAGSTAAPLNPSLGPLQNNGGPTLTIALLASSPALNSGDDTLLGAPFNLTTDQRGLPRKSGAHVDIGAFESQVGALVAQEPVRMLLPPQLPNQPFGLTVVAPPGTTGTIEVSADLRTWTTLTNFAASPEGTFEFNDYSAAGLPQRFYRVAAP